MAFGSPEICCLRYRLSEFKRLFAVPEPHFLSNRKYVFGSHVTILVLQVERRDTRDIGRYPHMIVRDADSRPYTPDLVRPLAEHLEMPDLIRVGDRPGIRPNPRIRIRQPIVRSAGSLRVPSCNAAKLSFPVLRS